MNVIHLVTEDNYGAGRAAIRISDALKKAGVCSEVYVLYKNNMTNSQCISMTTNKRIINKIFIRLNQGRVNRNLKNGFFHAEKWGIDFIQNDAIKNADILHFHWINNGIWSRRFAKAVKKSGKPIVWTMHDMWPFTGGCHYDNFCGKYTELCTGCPMLKGEQKNGLSTKEQKFKADYLSKANIQLVGCSKWITNEANSSMVAQHMLHSCVNVPNPINTEIFRIYDKVVCREILNINSNKKMILFGAVSATSDERKGYQYLKNAIKRMNPEEYVLGIFGTSGKHSYEEELSDFEVYDLGYINDDMHLALMYNAADVFVAPSIQENLANTVMESLACGTPVAAFEIGGMPDMIVHLYNGYLAKPYETEELSRGIEFCCNMELPRAEIVKYVKENFSEAVVSEKYQEIYHRLLQER